MLFRTEEEGKEDIKTMLGLIIFSILKSKIRAFNVNKRKSFIIFWITFHMPRSHHMPKPHMPTLPMTSKAHIGTYNTCLGCLFRREITPSF